MVAVFLGRNSSWNLQHVKDHAHWANNHVFLCFILRERTSLIVLSLDKYPMQLQRNYVRKRVVVSYRYC